MATLKQCAQLNQSVLQHYCKAKPSATPSADCAARAAIMVQYLVSHLCQLTPSYAVVTLSGPSHLWLMCKRLRRMTPADPRCYLVSCTHATT